MIKFLKIISIIAVISLFTGVFLWWAGGNESNEVVFEAKEERAIKINTKENTVDVAEKKEVAALVEKKIENASDKKVPDKILIDVPFSSQAPLSNWDAYHEEACEETSLMMVKYFLDKKKLTPEIAEKEIQILIDYELKKYGRFEDSDAEEVVQIAKDFYGIHNLKVVYDFKKDDLKKYLSLGNPIIIPAAGRLLGNPNFKVPGPLYHNLVLIGYDQDNIITNDPGTRKGREYRYDLDVLYYAIHDFPGDLANIEKGRKAMIVVE